MVTLPFVLLLLDWWPLRRTFSSRLLVEKLPFFALSLALSWVTYLSQQQAGALSMVRDLSLAERLQNAAIAYVWYLAKTLWPADLAILYPYPRTPDPTVWAAAAALLLALSGVAVWLRHRVPVLLPAWFGFLGILVPMIGLVQAGPQPYADRFSYIASIPLALGAVALLFPRDPVVPRRSASAADPHRMRPWLAGIAVILLVVLAVGSAAQVAVWRDGETVFAHATAVVPDNAIAATNLGALRMARGAYPEALAPLESAVRANPRYALAQYNLGLTLTHLDRLREAERALLRATALDPTRAEAWLALAATQTRQQQNARAVRSFRRALSLGLPPAQRAQAHTDLGLALIRTGQPDPAGEQFRLALEADPNYQPALINRAVFLYRRGAFAEALTVARRALEQNPVNPQLQGMVRTLEQRSNSGATAPPPPVAGPGARPQ
jgi:tetratricopeptide (TPR) repeat protein